MAAEDAASTVPEVLLEELKEHVLPSVLPDADQLFLRRISLRFYSKDGSNVDFLHTAFQRRNARRFLTALRITTIIFCLVNIMLIGFDYRRFNNNADSPKFVAALIIRLAVMLPTCILTLVFTYSRFYLRHTIWLSVPFMVLGCSLIAYAISGSAPGYGTLALLIVYMFSFSPLPVWPSCSVVVSLIIAFGVSLSLTKADWVNQSKSLDVVVSPSDAGAADYGTQMFNIMGILIVFFFIVGFIGHTLEHSLKQSFLDEVRLQMEMIKLEAEKQTSAALLNSMLPSQIVAMLNNGRIFIAENIPEVTVLFCELDLDTAKFPAQQVVAILNIIFTEFDKLVDEMIVRKIETVAAVWLGVSSPFMLKENPAQAHRHAEFVAELALGMAAAMPIARERIRAELGVDGNEIGMRLGLNSGPVAAGIVGIKNPRYKLIGDTVNTASRMESTCVAGCIQISQSCYQSLTQVAPGKYQIRPRGVIPVKGKGEMFTYWLEGRVGEAAVAPADSAHLAAVDAHGGHAQGIDTTSPIAALASPAAGTSTPTRQPSTGGMPGHHPSLSLVHHAISFTSGEAATNPVSPLGRSGLHARHTRGASILTAAALVGNAGTAEASAHAAFGLLAATSKLKQLGSMRRAAVEAGREPSFSLRSQSMASPRAQHTFGSTRNSIALVALAALRHKSVESNKGGGVGEGKIVPVGAGGGGGASQQSAPPLSAAPILARVGGQVSFSTEQPGDGTGSEAGPRGRLSSVVMHSSSSGGERGGSSVGVVSPSVRRVLEPQLSGDGAGGYGSSGDLASPDRSVTDAEEENKEDLLVEYFDAVNAERSHNHSYMNLTAQVASPYGSSTVVPTHEGVNSVNPNNTSASSRLRGGGVSGSASVEGSSAASGRGVDVRITVPSLPPLTATSDKYSGELDVTAGAVGDTPPGAEQATSQGSLVLNGQVLPRRSDGRGMSSPSASAALPPGDEPPPPPVQATVTPQSSRLGEVALRIRRRISQTGVSSAGFQPSTSTTTQQQQQLQQVEVQPGSPIAMMPITAVVEGGDADTLGSTLNHHHLRQPSRYGDTRRSSLRHVSLRVSTGSELGTAQRRGGGGLCNIGSGMLREDHWSLCLNKPMIRGPAAILEADFQHEMQGRWRKFVRLSVGLLIVLLALFTLQDWFKYSGNTKVADPLTVWRNLAITRYAVLVPLLLLFYATTYSQLYLSNWWFTQLTTGAAMLAVGLDIIALSVVGNEPGYGVLALYIVYCVNFSLLALAFRFGILLVLIGAYSGATLGFSGSSDFRSDAAFGVVYLATFFFGEMCPVLLREFSVRQNYFRQRRILVEKRKLAEEQARSTKLLENLVPPAIVPRLREKHRKLIADTFEEVTILWTDMKGFTSFSAGRPPLEVVLFLNAMFSTFDRILEKYGVRKIEVLGDAFFCCAGVPQGIPDHAERCANAALEMQQHMATLRTFAGGADISMRVGIHTGSVIAGVVGIKDPRYHLFGDCVPYANAMESHGEPGLVHISKATHDKLLARQAERARAFVEYVVKSPPLTVDVSGQGNALSIFAYQPSSAIEARERSAAVLVSEGSYSMGRYSGVSMATLDSYLTNALGEVDPDAQPPEPDETAFISDMAQVTATHTKAAGAGGGEGVAPEHPSQISRPSLHRRTTTRNAPLVKIPTQGEGAIRGQIQLWKNTTFLGWDVDVNTVQGAILYAHIPAVPGAVRQSFSPRGSRPSSASAIIRDVFSAVVSAASPTVPHHHQHSSSGGGAVVSPDRSFMADRESSFSTAISTYFNKHMHSPLMPAGATSGGGPSSSFMSPRSPATPAIQFNRTRFGCYLPPDPCECFGPGGGFFAFEERSIEIKGRGRQTTYFLSRADPPFVPELAASMLKLKADLEAWARVQSVQELLRDTESPTAAVSPLPPARHAATGTGSIQDPAGVTMSPVTTIPTPRNSFEEMTGTGTSSHSSQEPPHPTAPVVAPGSSASSSAVFPSGGAGALPSAIVTPVAARRVSSLTPEGEVAAPASLSPPPTRAAVPVERKQSYRPTSPAATGATLAYLI